MRVEIVSPTPDHLDHIAEHMNPRDAAEVLASGGFTPDRAVHLAHVVSAESYVCVFDGVPVAVFGVADLGGGVGSPWLLTTEQLFQRPSVIVKEGRKAVAAWAKKFYTLYNWIDERNDVSIRWLARLGFSFVDRDPHYGVACIPFLKFEMISPCVYP
jgi:hypothetical protein